MRITELFTAQSIALDEALQTQEEILSRLVELQATHGNITDKDAYKKALYAREAEGSTYCLLYTSGAGPADGDKVGLIQGAAGHQHRGFRVQQGTATPALFAHP